jgi:hypothetical protein
MTPEDKKWIEEIIKNYSYNEHNAIDTHKQHRERYKEEIKTKFNYINESYSNQIKAIDKLNPMIIAISSGVIFAVLAAFLKFKNNMIGWVKFDLTIIALISTLIILLYGIKYLIDFFSLRKYVTKNSNKLNDASVKLREDDIIATETILSELHQNLIDDREKRKGIAFNWQDYLIYFLFFFQIIYIFFIIIKML